MLQCVALDFLLADVGSSLSRDDLGRGIPRKTHALLLLFANPRQNPRCRLLETVLERDAVNVSVHIGQCKGVCAVKMCVDIGRET